MTALFTLRHNSRISNFWNIRTGLDCWLSDSTSKLSALSSSPMSCITSGFSSVFQDSIFGATSAHFIIFSQSEVFWYLCLNLLFLIGPNFMFFCCPQHFASSGFWHLLSGYSPLHHTSPWWGSVKTPSWWGQTSTWHLLPCCLPDL